MLSFETCTAAGELSNCTPEGRQIFSGQLQDVAHPVSELLGFRDCLMRGQQQAELVKDRVVDCHCQLAPVDPFSCRQAFQGQLHTTAVSPGQATGAKLGSTEVARDDCSNLPYAAVSQDGEHWPAGRAMWFAVITHADMLLAAGSSKLEGPAVMCGIREFLSYCTQEGFRFLTCRAVGDGGNEAAALDLLFNAMRFSRDQIPFLGISHHLILAPVGSAFYGSITETHSNLQEFTRNV